MSLETRINGMTAWANFRLQIAGHELMKNIVSDIMDGYNMKTLIECKDYFILLYISFFLILITQNCYSRVAYSFIIIIFYICNIISDFKISLI